MEQIRLDLIPNGIMPNVHASQFDKSRTVRFNLYEGDTPFTLLATDNVKVACNGVDDTTLATAGTSHDWTIPDSVVADSGVFIGELSVERGPKTIGSKNFVLNVEEDAYNGKNIEERTASGSIANFETNLQDNLTACKCEINPLQSGTGTPSPSNPRPISGFSGANIVRCGVNVWDEQIEQGAWSNSGTKAAWAGAMRSTDKFPIKPNTSYYFKFSGTVALYVCWFDVSANFIERVVKTASQVITTPSNAYYCAFCTSNDYGTTYNHDISINYPSTATAYKPYNGTTTAISFGQTAYGGVLDVTNGKLKITHKVYTFDGTEAFNAMSYERCVYFGLTDAFYTSDTHYNSLRCSHYQSKGEGDSTPGDFFVYKSSMNVAVVFRDSVNCTDATTFKNYLTAQYNNGTPVTLVYELATPTEITLTPKQIETLVGINNVYHDCNGEIEVKYLVEV